MSVTPLTGPSHWGARHLAGPAGYVVPMPSRYFLDSELTAVFARHLPGLRGRRVLEVGCGSSVWLPYFDRAWGLDAYGIDYSPEGLERERLILAARKAKANLVLGDVFSLAGGFDSRFSCVFSLGLVEHFADPGAVLALLARFVEPGGLLITWTPNTAGWIPRLSGRLNPAVRSTYATLDRESLARHQREAGLEIVDARYTQLLDLSMLNLGRLPRFWQTWVSRAFRALSLPQVALANRANVRPQSARLCSGIVTVARRPSQRAGGRTTSL